VVALGVEERGLVGVGEGERGLKEGEEERGLEEWGEGACSSLGLQQRKGSQVRIDDLRVGRK